MPAGTPVKVGISSCLLGENVRYNGRNKYTGYIVEELGRYVDFLPVCPETAIGLGVPRPPVRLLERHGRLRAVGVNAPEIDITEALTGFGKKQAAALGIVCGYIFKSRSPSCGLDDTPISTDTGEQNGTGLYTRQIIAALPLLPVTDEISLMSEITRNNFLERALACHRWSQYLKEPLLATRLRKFHTLHTAELARHNADLAEGMTGFLLPGEGPVAEKQAQAYLEGFMAILEMPAAMEMPAADLFERHLQLSAALGNQPD